MNNSVRRVIDPDYEGEIGLLLHNGDKDYVWSAGDPLGATLGATISCD